MQLRPRRVRTASSGFNLARLQSAGDSVQIYAAVSGQVATKNLDVSERCSWVGPMPCIYPEGESYADQGVLLTLEARYALPVSDAVPGQMAAGRVH